jgi:hypothetical protein
VNRGISSVRHQEGAGEGHTAIAPGSFDSRPAEFDTTSTLPGNVAFKSAQAIYIVRLLPLGEYRPGRTVREGCTESVSGIVYPSALFVHTP